jgi:hypothetical protein
MKISEMADAQLRQYYRRIRTRSEARTPQEFDAACVAYMQTHGMLGAEGEIPRAPWNVSPRTWVQVARKVTFMCRRCAGTGAFITYVENGQPKGPGGICYRCEGKGVQHDGDVLRNIEHDKHYMARACFA